MMSANDSRKRDLVSSRVAAKIAGIAYSTLHYWCQEDIVVPVVPPDGAGSDMWYSMEDLLALCAVASLRGMARSDMQRLMVKAIRRAPRARSVLVEISACIDLVLDLSALREQVEQALAPQGTKPDPKPADAPALDFSKHKDLG